MKNRFLCLCLAGTLLLGLASCSAAEEPVGTAVVEEPVGTAVPGGPQSSPTPTPVPTPPPTPEPTPTPEPFVVQAADVPPGDYEPWQEGYAAFLTELRQQEGELWNRYRSLDEEGRKERQDLEMELSMSSDSYWLYDIDENGIPELLVQYGNCEAVYHTWCYTYQEGEVVCIGNFECGHTSLWSWPGENGMLHHWYGVEHKITIEDGELVVSGHSFDIPENYYEEKGLDWSQHPDPADFIPGSMYIPSYRFRNSEILILPIYDYGALPRQNPAPMEEAEVRAAIGKVLWEGAELVGVSGDGFHGDTGLVTLEKYLHPDLDYRYTEEPISLTRYAWADANGDGQTDCILCLVDPERNLDAYVYVVLDCQNGQVYGYFFDFMKNAAVDPDGTIYFRQFEEWRQVSSYNKICRRFRVGLLSSL